MFGKSARRTGNIYVAPTELIAFLDNDSYKDIAPTELVPGKAENADRSRVSALAAVETRFPRACWTALSSSKRDELVKAGG